MTLPRPGRVATVNLSIAAVLVVALVVGFVLLHGGNDPATATNSRTATVSTGDVTATVSATGTSQPTSTSEVSFETSGTIATIKVKVGQTVKKGQVLATLETGSLQTATDVAQAKYDAAVEQYDAAVQSYDDAVAAQSSSSSTSNTNADNAGSGSNGAQSSAAAVASASSQLASAKANKLQAANDLDSAEQDLAHATLKSPRAGTVLTVNGTVGGSSGGSSSGGSGGSGSDSGSSTGLFTIADLTDMDVSASFAEADAMQLKVGQVATTVFNAATGEPITGKVTTVAPTPTTSNNVVSYAVTVSLSSLPKGLRSGQTATVTVTTGSKSNVLTVPSSAVTGSGTTHTVTVVANGKQTRTPVEVGLEGDQLTEITSGLAAGQQVLLSTASSTGSRNGFPSGGQFPGGNFTFNGGGGTSFSGGGAGR